MGACCCGSETATHPESTTRFQKGGANDLSCGPVQNRSCTDLWCLPFLLVAWVAYLVVTFADFADGYPAKLYLPRDFSGAYCSVESNWNGGPNTLDYKYLGFTMNVTATTDLIVKQLLCSSAGDSVIQTLGLSSSSYDAYQCACCMVPCDSCRSSYTFSDITSVSSLQSTVQGKMEELRGSVSAGSLFSPAGNNGDVFTNMWQEATKYFNPVCLPDCNTNFDTANSSTSARSWTYEMAADNPLATYWEMLKTSGALQATINDQFTFKALPLSHCPYGPSKCVPMPGVEFNAEPLNYCSFKMSSDVISAIGSGAASTLENLGSAVFTESETFGKLVGDFERAIDAFLLTAFCCFIIGFIYIVLLRFLIGPCVWCAVLLVQLSLILGGAACYIKSFQCAGSSIFETGQQVAVAVTVTVQVAATNAATGSEATSEALTGDGADYGGVQYRTKSGYACETWGSGVASSYTNPPYTTLAGAQNYCRNPYVATQTNKASTIWCFTTDPQTRWEECTPVGVIQPVCASGYAVTSEEVRKVLEIAGYVVWGFAFIYWLLVCCFFDRIQLAIAVNKVAATFVSHTMRIIGVPIVQAVVGILWILLWGVSVSFLVSQVPADYTPTGAYTTYLEAYGSTNTTGACTDKWPTGSVYKDEDNCTTIDGVPACWKCSPPRYVFDYRFAVSFFVFLWNNALNIAIGQCIIAGAVGVWFFTPNAEKGKRGAIKTSVWNVFRYHLGSLAFGSFIIAVIQFIRYLMNYFEKQAKAQKNRVMALILRCLQCCMYCFEQCIRFLNKNAYIQIALMGTNFCTSAKAAFFLILRNALRFGTVALLSTMVNLIGFFFIVAASVGLGYLFLQALHPDMAFVIPLLMYAMMAYVVAKLFLNVFGLAVDSTLQCFLACEEMDLLGDFVPGEMSKWLDKGHSIEDAHKKDVP